MIASRTYISKFANRYGEQWVFEYDCATAKGTLTGSDVGWQSYAVIEGRAPGLILNNEEILWLREAWAAALNA